jgi:hypothetical protein
MLSLKPIRKPVLVKRFRIGFSIGMDASVSVESSFPFYPADMTALNNRLAELAAAGVSVRRGRLLRALVHATPEDQLFGYAARLAALYREQVGPREPDNVAGRPAFELPAADLAKLDRVKVRLVREDIWPGANRAFVVRALVRWAPSGIALAPAVRRFLAEFPNKPRGLSKLRLERKAKHGRG